MNFIKNQNGEKILSDNEIIAYINGKAIIETEWGNLYYIEMPEEFVTIGETVEMNGLTEFEALSVDERKEILQAIRGVDNG